MSVKIGHIIAETVAMGAISILITFIFETKDEIINVISTGAMAISTSYSKLW